MLLNLKRLLRFDPLSALLIMVNQQAGTCLNPNQIKATVVEPLQGTLTRVTLSAFAPDHEWIAQEYQGNQTLTYHRLDLGTFFRQGLTVEARLPLTVFSLLEMLNHRQGLVFADSDFDQAVIEQSSFVLKAKASSLRWVGQVPVTVRTPA